MPDVERLLPRFRSAHTQVLGVSVDSMHCHASWAASLGGISFPLLADFNPKGAVGRAYGVYRDGEGTTARATVIIDADGIVRHAAAAEGARNIEELVARCEELDRAYGRELPALPEPPAPASIELYIKTGCGFCQRVLNALTNLHLDERIALRNVSDSPADRAELQRLAGKTQVPCLVQQGRPLLESLDIMRHLAELAAPLPG